MFSTKHIGIRDVVFDSKEEARVAEVLEVLIREKVVAGYLVHPFLSGLSADFLVQLGRSSGTSLAGRLVVAEYDGLGTARRESLLGKVQRYAELAVFGFDQAWITVPTYDGVVEAITNPGPPGLIQKIMRCPVCGQESSAFVIGEEAFTESVTCHAH